MKIIRSETNVEINISVSPTVVGMAPPLRVDATLGFVRSGLWFGQVVAAAALLALVTAGGLSAGEGTSGQSRVTVVAGGALVACALLRVLVSALLLTARGVAQGGHARATVGLRLVEALVACAAIALAGFVALHAVVAGDVETLAAVGTSQFDTFVVVLAVVVVVHAVGPTVFGRDRRAE
jgi:hypothetical protein